MILINDLLVDNTCVILYKNKIVFTSDKKGVAPILDFYHSKEFAKKAYVVNDRIVGRGAAILAALIGATKIVTPVISQAALTFCQEHSILVEYQKEIPYVVNRTKDGPCPIETAVLQINNIEQGYQMIIETLKKLQK